MHRKAIHIIVPQVLMDSTAICLGNQCITVFLRGNLVIECAWASYAAAVAKHALYKNIWQLSRP